MPKSLAHAATEDSRGLVARIRSGDYDAFVSVFRVSYDPLVGYATRLTRSPEAAEELVQDVFLRVWERRTDLVVTDTLHSYLYAAVRHRVWNWVRHERSLRRVASVMEDDAIVQDGVHRDPDPEKHSMNAVVSQAVASLPLRRRAVFERRWLRGSTHAEIARELGISIKTVEAHLAAALKTLRRLLRPSSPP